MRVISLVFIFIYMSVMSYHKTLLRVKLIFMSMPVYDVIGKLFLCVREANKEVDHLIVNYHRCLLSRTKPEELQVRCQAE